MKNVVGWFRRVLAALTHWVTATQSSNHPTTGRRVEGVRNTEVPQHPVGQATTIGEQRLGIVDLGTDVSRDLRLLIDKNILTRGEPFQSGGMLGPACLPASGGGGRRLFVLVGRQHFSGNCEPCHVNADRCRREFRSHGTGWHRGTGTIHCGWWCHSAGRRAHDVLRDCLVNDDVCALRSNSSVVGPARHNGRAVADARDHRGLRDTPQRDGASPGYRC